MPSVTIQDLDNAKLDCELIAEVATSLEATANDRLGNTKLTVTGAMERLTTINFRGAWQTATAYAVKDAFSEGSIVYVAVLAHTSTSIAADLSAGKIGLYQGVMANDVDEFFDGVDFTAGTTDELTLSREPGSKNNVQIFFGAAYQGPNQWNLTGDVITFNDPIPPGVTEVFIHLGILQSSVVPSPRSVSDDQLAWGSTLTRVVGSQDELRGLNKSVYQRAFVAGYDALGDGAAGFWWMDPSDTTSAEDRMNVIVGDDGGRWKLLGHGPIARLGLSYDWRIANGKNSATVLGEFVAVQQDDPGALATLRLFPWGDSASPTQLAVEPFFPVALSDLNAVGNGEDVTSVLCGKATDPGGDGSEERGGWIFKNYFGATQYRHHQIASFATITGTVRPVHVVMGGKNLAKFDHADGKTSFDNSNVIGTASQGNTVVDILNSPATENLRLFANAAGTVGISHLTGGVADNTSTWGANGVSVATGGQAPYVAQGSFDATSADASRSVELLNATHATYGGEVVKITTTRAQNTAFSFLTARASGNLTFNLRGDGNAFCDGAWNGGGADYAEFFEWLDGNPGAEDRVGRSVVLEGNKIRLAVAGDTDILGVISSKPTIVGDSAWNEWQGKYLTDDFGRPLTDSVELFEWSEHRPAKTATRRMRREMPAVGANGKPDKTYHDLDEIVELEAEATIQHAYFSDELPASVKVPANAKRSTVKRERLNPAFDPNAVYVPREKRREWGIVGLIGKLRVKIGSPVSSNWIKLRDISPAVTEYLIR